MNKNIYKHCFTARCPVNGKDISYSMTIESDDMIEVESIVSATDDLVEGYHEHFADELIYALGGYQVIEASHHGVAITTIRKASK